MKRVLASPSVGIALAALWAAVAAGCPAPAPPAPSAARVGTTAFIVRGRILSTVAEPHGARMVIVDAQGRPYRVLVQRLVGKTLSTMNGDEVTAWCQVAEGDSLADSMRVERAP